MKLLISRSLKVHGCLIES